MSFRNISLILFIIILSLFIINSSYENEKFEELEKDSKPILTLVSAWYVFKNKHGNEKYKAWIDNFLNNITKVNIVIYTNKESYPMLEKYDNKKNIKIIIKEKEEFMCYKYKDLWITNQSNTEKNVDWAKKISWEVNMLWNEKIHFIKETIKNNYFSTDFFAWCDIGYFRCTPKDTQIDELKLWPNSEKILNLNKEKVYYCYACKQEDIKNFIPIVLDKNELGLPKTPIDPKKDCIAGGFCILHKDKIDNFYDIYYNKLDLYLKNNYLALDDQMILLDCIISNKDHFELLRDPDPSYDQWFYFQRYLL